jgi:cytochrome c biogenesis protein CcdA
VPDASYALALAAGAVAAVNPCGFALLPAYLSLLLVGEGGERTGGRLSAVGRALVLTSAMTLGFVAVFGAFGLLAAPAVDAVASRLPWLSMVIGLVLVALGGWLLGGRSLPSLPGFRRAPAMTRRFGSMALFGVAYAVASLSCTIGPFLAVVATAGFRGGAPLAGVGLFLSYGLGMAFLVGSVALAVALARMSFVLRLRRSAPTLARAGGGVLVLSGAYVAWYGWYGLRVFADSSAADPVVSAAGRVQSAIGSWLSARGPATVAGVFVGLLVVSIAIAIAPRWLRRRERPTSAGSSCAADSVAEPDAALKTGKRQR